MAVIAQRLPVATDVATRAAGDLVRFRCDTEAELPSTNVQNGDSAFANDTKKMFDRAAGAWVERGEATGSSGGPHDHEMSEVTGLEAELDGKAPTAHTHAEADVTGLTAALAGKAASAHSHAQSDVTNLVADLAGKAASSHSHAQSDVTNLTADLAGKAATAHNHAAADINSGTIATARLGGGTANSSTYLRGDQTWATPAGGSPYKSLTICADAGAGVTLTNQANAEQFLANSNRNIHKIDLTGFTQVRLLARVVTGSASVNTPRIYLEYHTSFTTTVGTFSAIADSAVNCSLTTAGLIDSGWINLVAGAKADVFLAVLMNGGDAAADPALGWVAAEFK